VAGCIPTRLLCEVGVREETERSEAIVEGHDNGSFCSQVFAVIPGEAAGAAGKAAPVNPDHNRTTIVGIIGARPDVRIETVLAASRLPRRCSLCSGSRLSVATSSATSLRRCSCDAGRTKCVSFSYTFPLCSGLRRSPPVLTEGRRRERDPFED